MRNFFWILILMTFVGCSSVRIPTYLQDQSPYTRRFHADFEKASSGVTQALKELGWGIEEITDPLVYEQDRIHDLDEQRTMIITKTRQMPLFIGTRYARMNIFIRSKKNISEIEIRYLTITSFALKSFKNYRNKKEAERIFHQISNFLLAP